MPTQTTLTTYADYAPSAFDSRGAFLPDRQDWLVVPVIQTRDSGPLESSNFTTALKQLGGESKTVEVHRFGHWGPGWFEIILVSPRSKKRIAIAEDIANALADYPVLDESDFSEREQADAETIWKDCYNVKDRIEYIRKHRSQFEPRSLADLLGCVRGEYFLGYASELIY